MKFQNEKEKEAVQAIINNPIAAYDYGQRGTLTVPNDVRRYGAKDGYNWGYKKFEWSFTAPHNYLFQMVQAQNMGFSFQNISENQIRTTLDLWGQFYVDGINSNIKKVKTMIKWLTFTKKKHLLNPDKLKSKALF
ncbi:MAG: hypothetical protein CM15mP59_6790 [Flavobacteriaceae bacterium]|nr:MAG: hypothetical protein CM15mP59_6790 [Flavobacteriaceae bacterium]